MVQPFTSVPPSRLFLAKLGDRVAVIDQEHVRLVEIRRGVVVLRNQGVVARNEQAQPALLVESVRPGVRRGELQPVGKALARLKLQSIVIGDALGLVEHRIHVIPDVGHADRRVAGIVRCGRWFEVQRLRLNRSILSGRHATVGIIWPFTGFDGVAMRAG